MDVVDCYNIPASNHNCSMISLTHTRRWVSFFSQLLFNLGASFINCTNVHKDWTHSIALHTSSDKKFPRKNPFYKPWHETTPYKILQDSANGHVDTASPRSKPNNFLPSLESKGWSCLGIIDEDRQPSFSAKPPPPPILEISLIQIWGASAVTSAIYSHENPPE